jgi:hypothetical protein
MRFSFKKFIFVYLFELVGIYSFYWIEIHHKNTINEGSLFRIDMYFKLGLCTDRGRWFKINTQPLKLVKKIIF